MRRTRSNKFSAFSCLGSFPLETPRRKQLLRKICRKIQDLFGNMLLNWSDISVLVKYYTGSLVLFLAFIICRLVQLFPCAQWILVELMKKIATVKMQQDDYWQSLFTRPMFDSMRSSILLELQRSVREAGDCAPDSHVFAVDGRSRHQLLDFSEGNRPLVINFCSWTCPVFRARVDQFLSIVREFSDLADFLTVYVEEAHPCDGWAFKVRKRAMCEELSQTSRHYKRGLLKLEPRVFMEIKLPTRTPNVIIFNDPKRSLGRNVVVSLHKSGKVFPKFHRDAVLGFYLAKGKSYACRCCSSWD